MMWSVSIPQMSLSMVPALHIPLLSLDDIIFLEYHQPNEAIPPFATQPLPLRDNPLRDNHSVLSLATYPGICLFD